jgi:hypothetical protein
MTAVLESEIAKLTKRQKAALAGRLLSEVVAHVKPPGIMTQDDPALESEPKCRLADRRPGTWLTEEEFRAKTAVR